MVGLSGQQRAEFVEERGIRGQMRLDEATRLLVAGLEGYEALTREDLPHMRVGDEDRTAGGVKQDRVHRFGAETGDRQHLPPQCRQRRAAHAVEAPPEAIEEPSREGPKLPGLDPRRAADADDRGQLGFGERGEAIRAEQAARAQRRHRARGVRPRRAPGEHGPHRRLVRRPNQHGGPDMAPKPPTLGAPRQSRSAQRRPPRPRPEPPLQRHVEAQQPRLRGIGRRPRNLSPTEHA